jgi:iron complex outermembrane recepter protein
MVSAGAASVLAAQPGWAQAAAEEETAVGEIIVTATRKEETLSKVPLSIAAYSQQTMDQQNVRAVEDIARLTPGITFARTARGNGGQTNIAIRGIRSETGAATTGIYIDETPIQVRPLTRSGVNAYPRIFDLDRVEVLRGPQGTLFGAGAEGGTVRFITPTPSLTKFSAYGRSEASMTEDGDPSYELGGAVGGPIVQDKLGFRASVWGRRDGGWIDRVNYNTGRVEDRNSNGGDAVTARLALRWAATETLEFSPSIYYQRTTSDDSSFISLNNSDLDSGKFVNTAFIEAPSKDRFYLAALKAQWDIGFASIISNSSYFHRNANNTHDSTLLNFFQFTGLTNPVLPANLSNAFVRSDLIDRQRTFVQELRIQNADTDSRLNWVIGAFYSRQKQFNQYVDGSEWVPAIIRANPTYVARFGPNVTPEQAFNGVSLVGGTGSLFSQTRVIDKQIAGFGQIDYNITDKLKATAGIRYSDVKFDSDTFQAGVVVSTNGRRTLQATKATEWTPKFGLSYQADPDNMLYASAAKGFRPGAFQGAGVTRCQADLDALGLGLDPREIKPDYVWSYEVGAKSRLFNRKLSIDVSAYNIDWKDIQSQLNLPVCGTSTTANLGKARSRGFDLGLQWQATSSLQLGASIGYNNSEYTETTFGAINPTTGVRGIARSKGEPLGAAPWTVALSSRYDFELAGLNSYVRSDFQYTSKDKTPLDRVAAAVDLTIPRTPHTYNLDLRAGVNFDGFDISLFVANALNNHPILARYRDTTRSVIYRGVTVRPRTFGITGTYRY